MLSSRKGVSCEVSKRPWFEGSGTLSTKERCGLGCVWTPWRTRPMQGVAWVVCVEQTPPSGLALVFLFVCLFPTNTKVILSLYAACFMQILIYSFNKYL